jgi:hypothetical protein
VNELPVDDSIWDPADHADWRGRRLKGPGFDLRYLRAGVAGWVENLNSEFQNLDLGGRMDLASTSVWVGS